MFGNPVLDCRRQEMFADQRFADDVRVDERRGRVGHGVVEVDGFVGGYLETFCFGGGEEGVEMNLGFLVFGGERRRKEGV